MVDVSDAEKRNIRSQLGTGLPSKSQSEKIFASPRNQLGVRNAVEMLTSEHYKAADTLYFKNCSNCTYQLEAMCTKVFVESCDQFVLEVLGRVITSTVEIWKCQKVSAKFATTVQTVQMDLCHGALVEFTEQSHFNRLIWSACEELELTFLDSPDLSLQTGSQKMVAANPDINPQTDQFIVRILKNKTSNSPQLFNELIVRLQNGFPTTEREARAFDERQEANLQALARELLGKDVVLGKKKADAPKVGRNDACPCGSTKKYKKCCGTDVVA